MISLCLPPIVLAVASVNLSGYFGFLPITFFIFWLFFIIVTLVKFLPEYVDSSLRNHKLPCFFSVQKYTQWIIILPIIALHTFTDPSNTFFPFFSQYMPHTTILAISIGLYYYFLKIVSANLFKLFKFILAPEQTPKEFFRARIAFPMLIFPPLFLWMVIEDILSSSGSSVFGDIKMVVAVPAFFLLLNVLAPRLFCWAWQAKTSDWQQLNELVIEMANKSNTEISGLKIWNTFNEPIPNAAVTGLFKKNRFVYVTDYLLKLFNIEQTGSVIAHELAHVKLGHLYSFMMYAFNMVLLTVIFKLSMLLWYPNYMESGILWTFFELAAFVFVFFLSFTALARKSEYEADAFASLIAGKETFISGLKKLESIIDPVSSKVPVWLLSHPHLHQRIEKVKNCQNNMGDIIKTAGKTRLLMLIITVVLFVLSVIPVSEAWQISRFERAAKTDDFEQMLLVSAHMSKGVSQHPLVSSLRMKYFIRKGNWTAGLLSGICSYYRTNTITCSEVFHHATSPEIALDLKLMQFVLQSFYFR